MLLCVPSVKFEPPKITEFSELMILFVEPPIIELPLRQTLKVLPQISLPVRPLVLIKLPLPPIIDESIEKEFILLQHPPRIPELLD